MGIIKAPFTEDEVYNLNKWQADGRVHPFTCGTKEKHKSGDSDVLVATIGGWVCPSCDYKQDWAHGFMTSPVDEPRIGFPDFPEMSGGRHMNFSNAKVTTQKRLQSMKTKHTPGPWWVDDDGFVASRFGDDYETVADPFGNEANAKLIAAAPDLLEALIALANIAEDEDCFPTFTEKARQAIQKATE